MKKSWIALTLIAAMLAVPLFGCWQTGDPAAEAASVFTLDVNPGIRVYVKADDTVLSVEATNDDGSTVVAELNVSGQSYEAAVEAIIDKMEEKGYLEGENNSVLLSFEKQAKEISAQINNKINAAFEKHGKQASIIEQELTALAGELNTAVEDMAARLDISKGKAMLIEKIREEHPELKEAELAALRVNDLGVMLEQLSDDAKRHFKKIGEAVEDAYVGRTQAIGTALLYLDLSVLDLQLGMMPLVRIDYEDGKMVYEVTLIANGAQYEVEIDAESGAVLSSESEAYEAPDFDSIIEDFCREQGFGEGFLENLLPDGFFGQGGDAPDMLSRGEILRRVMAELEILASTLEDTEIELHQTEGGAIFSVTLETTGGDVYELVVEAYTGALIRATLNGTVLEIELTPAA